VRFGLLSLLIVSISSAARAGTTPVLAVFDAEGKEVPPDVRTTLSDYLATRLAATGQYQVVPRDDIKRRLLEQKKESYRACYEESCQIEIGKELAAEQVVSTQIISAGELCIFTVKIYDLRKATTSRAAAVEGGCGKADLLRLVAQAVEKLSPSHDETAPAGLLGFRALDLTPQSRGAYAIPWEVSGVVIASVTEDSSAANAGLREGDVITEARIYQQGRVDAVPAGELHGLADLELRPDAQLGVTVWRAGGRTNVYVRSSRSRDQEVAFGPMGMLTATINFELRTRFHIPDDVQGLVVTRVEKNGSAVIAGLAEGDVILEAAVPTKDGYRRLTKAEALSVNTFELPAGQKVLITVWSKGKKTHVHLTARAVGKQSPQPRNEPSGRTPIVR
jgi:hypothetical protein